MLLGIDCKPHTSRTAPEGTPRKTGLCLVRKRMTSAPVAVNAVGVNRVERRDEPDVGRAAPGTLALPAPRCLVRRRLSFASPLRDCSRIVRHAVRLCTCKKH